MRRREFITLLGSAAAVVPFAAAPAQSATRIRKVGVLTSHLSDDREGQARIKAFAQALQRHGWVEGENKHTDTAKRGQERSSELRGGSGKDPIILRAP
jgi:hypothetical protein